MAMSVGGGEEGAPMSEMNTTPLIDVMLVLLIMFILNVPLATHASKIDNPPPVDTPPPPTPPVRHEVGITFDNTLLWDQQPIDQAALLANFASIAAQPKDQQPDLLMRPDPYSKYQTVARVVAAAQLAGITKMGFIGNEQYATQ